MFGERGANGMTQAAVFGPLALEGFSQKGLVRQVGSCGPGLGRRPGQLGLHEHKPAGLTLGVLAQGTARTRVEARRKLEGHDHRGWVALFERVQQVDQPGGGAELVKASSEREGAQFKLEGLGGEFTRLEDAGFVVPLEDQQASSGHEGPAQLIA